MLSTGGLNIYTTLDLDLQDAAANAMTTYVPFSDSQINLGSSAVSVQPGTGRVLEMVQNKNYSQDPSVLNADPTYDAVNYSTDFAYGGSSGFQPGSTYKVFTLGDWLNTGHTLTETFNGSRRDFSKLTWKDSCETSGVYPFNGPFNPTNDGSAGANNAIDATKYSVNSAYISMASQLDLCQIKGVAQSFGVHRADGQPLQMNPSDVLGTQEVAPLTMAAAYAGIANNGLYCTPVAIDKITDSTGAEIAAPKTQCSQALAPDVVTAMQYAMQQTFTSGGTAVASNTNDGIQHIGKTGTTDGDVATWMDGASTKVATVVWVGNIQGFGDLRQLYTSQSGKRTQLAVIRHQVWPAIMKVADAKYGGDPFGTPDPKYMKSVATNIPDVTGMSMAAAQAAIEAAGFVFQDGGPENSALPSGQATRSDPSGSAGKGSTITVYSSDGTLVVVPNVVGMPLTTAVSTLTAAGIGASWTTATTPIPTGVASQVVITQSVPAGQSVARNSSVSLSISP